MHKIGTLILFACLLFCPSTQAQPQAASPTQTITLGNSAVTLPGPWKFSPGDSPWQNGSPLWAQPGFDDANWTSMDLAPESGSVDAAYGTPGFVPGWTKRGYPNLQGYAWFRLRVHVTGSHDPIWIKMPNDVDDAYQVYADGRYVGEFGHFSADHVTAYSARSFSFPLPPRDSNDDIELAVRFYMTGGTRFTSPDAGGMHQSPALGLASSIHLLQTAEDDANQHFYFSALLQSLLFLLIAPLVLWAWLQDRRELTYLWLFFPLACSSLRGFLVLYANLHSVLPIGLQTILLDVVLAPLVLPLWSMFWWHWFGLREKRWIPRVAWSIAAAQALALLCVRLPTADVDLLPRAWLPLCNTVSVWCVAALGVLLLIILIEGFSRDRTEALLAALPLLLVEFSSFNAYIVNTFHIASIFFPFGVGIGVTNVAWFLMVLVIGALVMRRFLRTQVHQELSRQAIALDLEQAQQLQQRVLVPEALTSRFFTVEAEYRPAQTVGGDFFQTLMNPDGSLLVVIGDVSGKGISAAMLVAVLVGAIRNQADYSFDPAAMLTMLNRRMLGRSGGHFATCLVAHILADGAMSIANAGHMPPYLNGKEIELEGSLPLGLSGESISHAITTRLCPKDRLTFLTDGVVEAANTANELFGFDRVRLISSQSATSIVQQAQTFGQNDDITVLSVEFVGALYETWA